MERKLMLVHRLVKANPALMQHPTIRRFCRQHAVLLGMLTGVDYAAWSAQ